MLLHKFLICTALFSLPIFLTAQWTTETLPEGRSEINSVSIGDNVYFIGGALSGTERYWKMDVYNVPGQSWSSIDIPNGSKGPRSVTDGSKIYVADIEGEQRIDIYDPQDGSWTQLTVPSFISELAYMDSKLFVLSNGDLAMYDLVTENWTEFDFAYAPGGTLVATQGKVAITNGSSTDLVRIYDVAQNSWSEAALSTARDEPRGIGYGNRMFFVGGETAGFAWTDRIDVYNVDTDTWTTDNLSVARNRFDLAIHDEKLYVAGGQIVSFSSAQWRPEIDILDLNTNTWETVDMPTGRRYPTVVGHDDKIYVAGGDNDVDNLDLVEIYQIMPTGTIELERSSVSLYPNPVLENLQLQSEVALNKLSIFDVSGRLIFSEKFAPSYSRTIELAELNEGIYFLFAGDGNVPRKFVKL